MVLYVRGLHKSINISGLAGLSARDGEMESADWGMVRVSTVRNLWLYSGYGIKHPEYSSA